MQALLETFPSLAIWLSANTPELPGLALLRWAQPVLWGVVLAGLAALLLARQPHSLRRGAMVLAVLWMLGQLLMLLQHLLQPYAFCQPPSPSPC